MAIRKQKRLWQGALIANKNFVYEGWVPAVWEGWRLDLPADNGGVIPIRTNFAIEGKHNVWVDACDNEILFISCIPDTEIIYKL